MALNRQNSISAGRLRAAVDSVLIPGDAEPDPQAEALLRQYAAGALRHILDRQDPALLAAAIRSGLFPSELAGRVAGEYPALGVRLRLLLEHPELADAVPPPRRQANDAPPAPPETAEAAG